MKFKSAVGRVLIEAIKEEEKTSGGIIINGNFNNFTKGVVAAKGSNYLVGRIVYYQTFNNDLEITLEGKKYLLIDEKHIVGEMMADVEYANASR